MILSEIMSPEMEHFLNFCIKSNFNIICIGLSDDVDKILNCFEKEYVEKKHYSYKIVDRLENCIDDYINQTQGLICSVYATNIKEALYRIACNYIIKNEKN